MKREDERLVRVAVLANGCHQEHGCGNHCSCCLACCVTRWTLFMNVLAACKKKDQSLSDINLPDMDPSSEFQFQNPIKTYCSIIQVIEFIVCILQNTYDLFYITFLCFIYQWCILRLMCMEAHFCHGIQKMKKVKKISHKI